MRLRRTAAEPLRPLCAIVKAHVEVRPSPEGLLPDHGLWTRQGVIDLPSRPATLSSESPGFGVHSAEFARLTDRVRSAHDRMSAILANRQV